MRDIADLLISFLVGIIIGCLVTKRTSHRALYCARLRGFRQGRKEQELLVEQLGRRVIHLEAIARRMTFASLEGGRKQQ